MQIIQLNKIEKTKIIEQAISILENGGLVVAPTETTYGVLADATNSEAVIKVLAFKRRLPGKALSILVPNQKMAEKYVELNDQAVAMYKALLPGAYTIISRGKNWGKENIETEIAVENILINKKEVGNKERLAPEIFSENGNVGVRIPDYELVRAIGAAFGRPLTATSANLSGGKNPYTIDDVFTGLRDKQKKLIDLVIDAGKLPSNPPSVVIDTTTTTPIALRGELPSTKISKKINIEKKLIQVFTTQNPAETQALANKIISLYQSQIAKKGLVVALDGPLGAGKTIFSQGIATALKLPEPLTSPTYTYVKEYNFLVLNKEQKNQPAKAGKLFHLDAWRIENEEELEFLQPQNWLGAGKLVLIEWYDQIAQFWEEKYLTEKNSPKNSPLIHLEFCPDEKNEQKRQIKLTELTSKN